MKENVENLHPMKNTQEEVDLIQKKIKASKTIDFKAEEKIEKEENKSLFTVSIKCSETKDFYKLSKKFDLRSIINIAEDIDIVSLDEITLEEKLLLYQIVDQIKELGRKNIHLGNMDLAFRYVGEKPDLKIDEIIERAKLSGGKSPSDKNAGTWMSDYNTVSKSLEFLQMNDNAVIFVYDKSKLTPIESDEVSDDYAETWKMKPKEALEIRDTLLGMFIFENRKKA